MSIRIRKTNGNTIAICAAKSKSQEGDIYLDDNVHHALSTKFAQDFHNMGFMNGRHLGDSILIKLMKQEEDYQISCKECWYKENEECPGIENGEIGLK